MAYEQKNVPEKNGKEPGRRPKRAGVASEETGIDPAIAAAFANVPASRADMVARARRLARDPNYPSDEILRIISEILATHLEFDGYSY